MDDEHDRLSDDELDRGLSAAFRRPATPDDEASSEPLPRHAAHDVAETIDLESEGPEDGTATGDAGPTPTPRYETREEIARGGMGVIYQARDRDLRRSVAMKVLIGSFPGRRKPGTPVHADHLNRFLEEAQVTAQLAHPGIVPVHELGVDAKGRVFFTMGLVRGKTLAQIIQLARRREDGWTRTRVLQVILRVCETLAFAHDKGVIHRDIKPENVMVGRFGETYVMDWGLAKVLGRADVQDIDLRDLDAPMPSVIETKRDEGEGHDSPIMTMDGAVVGTPAYMPPEQARGAIADVDERADVYAIGALLYQLLTGHPPYVEPGLQVSPRALLGAVHMGPPKPIDEIDADLPDEITAICEKAMARERDDRYASALELAEDLQAYIEGHVVKAHRTGPVVELRKWIGRNRALATSLAAAVLIAVVGSIGFAIHARNAARVIGLERDKVDAERAKVAIERDREAAARRRAEGLRISARAGNEGIRYPGTALGLAIQGAMRADDVYGRTALYRAMANLHEVAALEGHRTYPAAVAFDETAGRLVSVAPSDGEVIVWDLATRSPLVRIEGRPERYAIPTGQAVAIAPFGRRVAMAANNRTIWVSDPMNGRILQSLELGSLAVSMSWDAAGERLAVVTEAGRVRVWRPPADNPVLEFDLDTSGPAAIALRPDGAQVAVQGPDGAVLVRDVATGRSIATLPAHGDRAELAGANSRLAWLDGGRQLLSWRAGGDRTRPARAEIWDLAAGRRVAAFGDGERTCLRPVWNATGAVVALPLYRHADATGHVVVWDAAERRERCRLPEPRFLYCLSEDGRHLVTNEHPHHFGHSLQLWDARTGELRADLRGHTYSLGGAAVTDDGLVATTSGDSKVRVWRSASVLALAETADWDEAVADLFADLRRAVVRRGDVLEVRSVPDRRVLYTLPAIHLSIDRVRNRLAYHDREKNRIHVVDGWEGRPLRDWKGDGRAAAVEFSTDGSRLAVLAEGRFDFRDPDSGLRLGGFDPGLGPGVGFTWCPDGRAIVIYERATRQLMECEVPTGTVRRRFEDHHSGWITTAAVSRSGRLLATGAADRSVVLRDRATGEVLHQFTGLFMGDLRLQFDPTERFLVVRQATDTLSILDVERREVFAEVPVNAIRGFVRFEGADAIVGAGDGERVLRLPLDPLAAARRALPHPLSPMELGVYDVGDPVERAALQDEYVAFTFVPRRILYVALGTVADGDLDRAAKHLARIEKIAPKAHERLVLRAALHLARGDSAAALEALERAVDEGCDARLLRHRVFDALRETPGWDSIEQALGR